MRNERLDRVLGIIDANIDLLPDILIHASSKLIEFKNKCEKKTIMS